MTEQIAIQNGVVAVKRAPHKGDLEVDLSDVERAYYERGVRGSTGALVLVKKDGSQDVIRVDQEDAQEVLEAVLPMLAALAEPVEAEKPVDNSEAAPVASGAGTPRQQKRR